MYEKRSVDMIMEGQLPADPGGLWYGVYPALVIDIKDPDNLGRVKITLPWAPDTGSDRYESWARLSTLMAGNNRGSWFIPDVDDEVLIAFEGGNPRRPYIIGGLWNGRDSPPESMDASGKNNIKTIRSRNGVKVTLDDKDGRERLILETPGGQKITMEDAHESIKIKDCNGNSIKMESHGITVNSTSKLIVNAGGSVEISASIMKVNAGMSKFSGVVQADTVITNSVVSQSYTPGAGNIW